MTKVEKDPKAPSSWEAKARKPLTLDAFHKTAKSIRLEPARSGTKARVWSAEVTRNDGSVESAMARSPGDAVDNLVGYLKKPVSEFKLIPYEGGLALARFTPCGDGRFPITSAQWNDHLWVGQKLRKILSESGWTLIDGENLDFQARIAHDGELYQEYAEDEILRISCQVTIGARHDRFTISVRRPKGHVVFDGEVASVIDLFARRLDMAGFKFGHTHKGANVWNYFSGFDATLLLTK